MTLSVIDQYIHKYPPPVQDLLQKMRRIILSAVPKGTETMSYGIPTIDLLGKHLVHFAAFKDHISFFPTSSPIPVFEKELAGYKISKGTIQFPLDTPIPYDLVKK